jgi:ribosomal-protein-alanine N-acetyltransferase
MNALWRVTQGPAAGASAPVLLPMMTAQLDAVMAIELAAYPFPWTRGNFADSLVAGHLARVLCDGHGEMLGYLVAMAGFEDMHLLNITVAPAWQGRGHARALLALLAAHARQGQAREIWLEVRAGNHRAQALYERLGYARVGVRRGYYPAPAGQREDAIVMRLPLVAPEAAPDHALD